MCFFFYCFFKNQNRLVSEKEVTFFPPSTITLLAITQFADMIACMKNTKEPIKSFGANNETPRGTFNRTCI